MTWQLRPRRCEFFKRGFLGLCQGPALGLFTPLDLQQVVQGHGCLDISALQTAATYRGGYDKDTPVVTWLWELLASFSIEDINMFLKFVTATSRAPVGGLSKVEIIISGMEEEDSSDDEDNEEARDVDQGRSELLPTAQTCTKQLTLPRYPSNDVLEAKLRIALQHATGFGKE